MKKSDLKYGMRLVGWGASVGGYGPGLDRYKYGNGVNKANVTSGRNSGHELYYVGPASGYGIVKSGMLTGGYAAYPNDKVNNHNIFVMRRDSTSEYNEHRRTLHPIVDKNLHRWMLDIVTAASVMPYDEWITLGQEIRDKRALRESYIAQRDDLQKQIERTLRLHENKVLRYALEAYRKANPNKTFITVSSYSGECRVSLSIDVKVNRLPKRTQAQLADMRRRISLLSEKLSNLPVY